MLSLFMSLTANAMSLDENIDAVCAKPETLTVVVIVGPTNTPMPIFNKIQSCKRDGNRLTLVQGEKDTVYVNLDHYGTIQIGHGKNTWLRLAP